MDKCLGFGGVGDCFIVILKLLEHDRPLFYTHIDVSKDRIKLSDQLLDLFNIEHECIVVEDIKQWWEYHSHKYDKCFNVFAKGYIDIPVRPYHWQPCIDKGYHNPFTESMRQKSEYIAVQVHSGGQRSYKYKPVVQHVRESYDTDKILWLGTDTDFKVDYGVNHCGKLSFVQALRAVSTSKSFVGFPSVLLYWALWHKKLCYLFTDHQGRDDLRMHEEWKKLLTYDI